MDFRLLVACCIATLALGAGCRQNNAHRELLERELRFQEDRIYQLEGELEQTRRELSRFCEVGATPGGATFDDSHTRSDAATSPDSRPSTIIHSNELPPKNAFAVPDVDLPAPTTARKEAAPPFVAPPVILPPDPNVPEGQPSRAVTPGDSSPTTTKALPSFPSGPIAPPTVESKEPPFKSMSSPKFLSPNQRLRVPMESGLADPAPEPIPQAGRSTPIPTVASPSNPSPPPSMITAAPLPSDDKIMSLAFGKRTGGLNVDGRPGDEGILVVFEPRTARGEVIAGNGDLSVVLLDPAVSGEGARYARWEFSGSDLSALFRPASADGPAGTYLELTWPDAPPQHARLKLFLRLRTPDGRQLQIDRDISVMLPVGASTMTPTPQAPVPFAPTLAPPRVVTPVGAPTPDEHTPSAASPLNWGKPSNVQPAVLAPPLPTQPGNSIFEPTPLEGPSLGPALLPAGPR
jgi:hypothetical protein